MNRDYELPERGFVHPALVKKRYSISNSTMYAWLAANHLPPLVKLGPRAVRFRAEQLAEWEAKLRPSKGDER